jgi:hypothetical protein
MHEFTPEVLYSDTVSKKRAYGELSKRYAANGDLYGAVHAAFAADVQTVQAVMWERVMVASPVPEEQFKAVGETVTKALTIYAATPVHAATAREAVEQARAGMAAAFDPVAQRIIDNEYLTLDHLDGLPHPDSAAGDLIAETRTKGEDPALVAQKRRRAAKDCMSVAVSMQREGRLDDAMRQAWQADWATFESYLLDAAAQVGDKSLITVEMRWALATEAISKIPALPSDFAEAVNTIRTRLLNSLGTIEGQRLAARFEPIA